MNRKKRKNNSSPLNRICGFLMVLLTAGFLFAMVNHYFEKQQLLAERDELIKMISEQNELTTLYKEELERVGTPQYYEYMARKYLGYIYPDEKVLIYDIGGNQ
ncbi:MAG: hypothetical protein GX061_02620 [Eubacteriaceae bacterium]|jgi:hypothetical protein|nr:hypothetical protein [Eubacteriaceae bacterium]